MKQREIKFRAWVQTTHGKEMINDWCFLNVQDNHFHAVDLTNERPDVSEVLAVMQYTGLKDKNNTGEDLYEGDVVYLAGYGNYVCEFPFIQLYLSHFEGDVGSKIGNIYENPELVNA